MPGMLMGAGGMSDTVDPATPVYEQDDPNLHPQDSAFERVQIPVPAPNVMALDIDDQDRVYVLGRAGGLQIWYPGDARVVDAGTLPVFSGNEDGALSISLDPNFSSNGWAYIYYSSSKDSQNVLSRFNITADKIDLASERVLLTVPEERAEMNHAAGATDFDSKGNLYLSTGDNTNPFQSNGFSPHDERDGRRIYDAQRTAANSRDLRGKILRIKPTDDGTPYEIPAGNLFAPDGSEGAPEIYTMGDRNPFRIAIDTAKDWLYWGEVGPDAGDAAEALATRGPRGYDEFNQAKAPGFFGWPYCIANNVPYVHVDFATLAPINTFNCDAPVNASPNNTGTQQLPPAQPAWIAYSYGSTPYPALGSGGRSALIADIYRWKPGGSVNKLPRYYDGSVLLMEYVRGLFAEVRTNDDGAIQSVNPFLSSFKWQNLIQARISPNGVLHLAQYGGGTGSNVTTGGTSTVYRINYVGSNAPQ